MLGAVIVTRNGGHLGAYFLRDRASGRVKAVILIVSIIVEISFMITVLVGSLVMIPILENTKAITMRWFRMDFLYWVVITASLLMVIVFLKDLVLAVQRLISGKTDDLVSEVSRPMIKKN
jgi:TRAP-type C4-dicarboxylate transport system permease small subunit